MILLSTVIDVIIDIYRGMINILKTINSKKTMTYLTTNSLNNSQTI